MNVKLLEWNEDEDDFIFLEEKEMTREQYGQVLQTEIRPFMDIVFVTDKFVVFEDDYNEDICMLVIS